MSVDEVADYRKLINQFLSHEIDVSQFERSFLEQFKNEQRQFPENVFTSLDTLFGDVDMFCEDDDLRDDDELNEEQLRQSCERALPELGG